MRDVTFRHRAPKAIRTLHRAMRELEAMGKVPAFNADNSFRHTRGFVRIALGQFGYKPGRTGRIEKVA